MSYLKRIFQSSESGVTLILVLMLVAAVGLIVVPIMMVSASGLRATNLSEQRFMERYAVDAGVEHALWRIKHLNERDDYSDTLTFNDIPTDVTITLAPPPPNPQDPDLTQKAAAGERGVTGYKTVSENLVTPCAGASCSVLNFTYTLYIENYGNVEKEDFTSFGDCLPPGFVFQGVRDVGGFENDNWSGPIQPYDMKPKDGTWTPGTFFDGVVGGVDDDNPNPGRPQVSLRIDESGSDLAHPCTQGRWQLTWTFGSPRPEVPQQNLPSEDGRAFIVIDVSVPNGLASGVYYNEMWWEPKSQAGAVTDVKFSCETSPVYARYPEWDIISSAGGTSVKARATIREDLSDKPITILSWQVGDGTSNLNPPAGTVHVGRICGRTVETNANTGQWEAEAFVLVHDADHQPLSGVDVTGSWDVSGNQPVPSCTTDTSGRCLLKSGKLDVTVNTTTFMVDQDGIDSAGGEAYQATFNHVKPPKFTGRRPS